MRKTAVYLFAILSLLSLGLTFLPMGYSQTQSIKILGYSYYFDNQGILDVVGQVQNIGTSTIMSVILTGSVYEPGSSTVIESNSYTQVWASYITPGQEAPFYMEFYPPQNSNSNYWSASEVGNIGLTVTQANATSSYQYPDLKIVSSTGSIGTAGGLNGAYVVNGEIKNTGTQPATNVTVVGAFFNSTGSVVGVGYTDYLTPQVLTPGNTTTFQIAAFDLNQTIVPASLQIRSYQLLVQTELPILQGTPPPTTSTSPSTGTSSSTSSGSSTAKSSVTSKNSSFNTTMYVIIIAAVLLAVAAAGAVLLLRRSKSHMTVKEARKVRKQKAS